METTISTDLQADIERRLAASEPDVEVLLAELSGGELLRVFIDHPDGVTLATCERVSLALTELRERYALEVSSPGSERPLSRPEHFQRFAGRRARVRTSAPLAAGDGEARSTFSGEIVAADGERVTIATAAGLAAIEYGQIRRANLIEE